MPFVYQFESLVKFILIFAQRLNLYLNYLILSTSSSTGQKYQFAMKWKISIVRSEWLYESIEKGFCQDVDEYTVTTDTEGSTGRRGRVKTSTPERHSAVSKWL